jgi:hypothetical protein
MSLRDILNQGGSEKGGIKLATYKPPTQTLDDLTKTQVQNEKYRMQLAQAGEKDPTVKKGPSGLDRIFGILDTPGAGVRTIAHNLLNKESDQDLSIAGEMLKSLKGEDRVEGADILADQGVKNKWAKMLGGIAIDILLDPVTYLGFGLGSFTKAESSARLAQMASEGIDAAKLADYGVDAAKYADKLDDAGKLAVGFLETDDSRKIASAVRAAVGAEQGNAGGIKFMGQTIAPIQDKMEALVYKGKDAARATKLGDWVERAFINGTDTEFTKLGNEVFNAGLKMANRKRSAAIQGANLIGDSSARR